MKAFGFLFVVAFIAIAAESASLLEKHPIDWYDCSGKTDGNYLHPFDCTRFISCSGHVASERDCAACDPQLHPTRCPSVGRLVYNDTVDACLWADETACDVGTPTPPGNSTTTQGTPRPTQTNRPTTDGVTNDPPTTENPEEGPVEGTTCDPKECVTFGDCLDYWRCDPNSLTWVKERCGDGLLWNPLGADRKPHIHGGNCGDPRNLFPETLEKYWNDERCLECYWKENGECSSTYFYLPPKQLYPVEQRLECDAGLVFVKDKETCLRCQDVQKANGQFCC